MRSLPVKGNASWILHAQGCFIGINLDKNIREVILKLKLEPDGSIF